jgi:hypothetical protein
MLTTGLDNLLGTNGNDVVLAVLDGEDSTLELDDAFNALMGQDTLRLDAVVADSNVDFDSSDYHFVGFERVLVQARADNLDINLDLEDMVGVDLEVRNMLTDFEGELGASLYAEDIGGDVLVVNFDGYELDLNNVGGDIVLRDIYVGYPDSEGIDINTVGGDVLIEDFEVEGTLSIDDVAGDVILLGNVDSEGDINSNIDGNVSIDGVGGNVTISNVDFDSNLDIIEIGGNTVAFNNVDVNNNIDIYFADTVTSAVINLNGLDASEGDDIDVDGINVTNYTFNVTADSDINELHLNHDNNSLSQVTINLINADLGVEDLRVASEDEDGNIIASTLTINGTGNLYIGDIDYDDASNQLDIVYTGSGSIDIGSEGKFEPHNGSFNASTATGDVTIELDLNEAEALDFTYVGSKGDDRVTIEEDSLGNAASDENTIALSLAGGTGVDTLVVFNDSDLTAEAMAAVSGFEVLELQADTNDNLESSDGNYISATLENAIDLEGDFYEGAISTDGIVYDLEHAHEFSSVVVDADGNESVALINLSAQQAANLTFKHDAGTELSAIILELENHSSLTDVATINIITDESSGEYEGYFAGLMLIDDVETINFNITGDDFYKDGDGNYLVEGDMIAATIASLVAVEAERINITGSVNFAIGTIGVDGDFEDANGYSSDLRLIDATEFTGDTLVLGGWMGPFGVFAEDDLIIRGSAVSDHFIGAWSLEDMDVTTGSGDDNMYLYSMEDITVNSGSGDDDINVNANGDVVINAGEGNDSVFVYEAVDATITLGAGNDEFDYNYDGIYGDLTVDAGAGDDNININLDSDENLDSATVTLGAGADELYLGSTRYDASNDIVVTVTDFAIADDILYFDEDEDVEGFGEGASYITVGTQDGDYDVTDGISASDIGLIEFTFDADNNEVELDIASTGADLLAALGDDGDSAVITVNNDQVGYIVAYNGGNAYVFNYESNEDGLPTAAITSGGGDGEDDRAIITFTEGTGDGWEAGDVITISGLVMDENAEGDWEGSGSFTYTVEADDSITDIAAAIAAGINNYTDSDYTATFAAGVVTVYDGSAEYDPEDGHITVTFTESANTDTVLDADQIELIGVLENVAVGSLSTANFGFFDWSA